MQHALEVGNPGRRKVMPTPLLDVVILSIYQLDGKYVMLPRRMARATPDMRAAIMALSAALAA